MNSNVPKPTFEGLVEINGLNLFVRQFGNSTKDLVFIHGGPDWDQSYFLPFVLPLADQYRLTFFDLRGCGRSTKFGKNSQYSIQLAADDLDQLIKILQLKEFSILGFSFGGRVLLEYLASSNSKPKAIILASTTVYTDYQPELDGWDDYQNRNGIAIKENVNRLFSNNSISAEEKSRKLAFLTSDLDIWNLENTKILYQTYKEIKFSGEWMNAWQSGALKPTQTNYEKTLNESQIPTLILHGEKDMRFPISVAKKLNNAVPNSKTYVIQEAGHMAHLEQPKIWNEAILNFLNMQDF